LGAPDNATMQALIKQFNSTNTDGITVVDTELDWNTLYSKLALDFKTGNAPDAVTLQQTDILEEEGLGLLQPIDSLVTQFGFDSSDVIDVAWKGTLIGGKQYAIPIDVHPLTLYINTDEFKAAGLDPTKPPTTMTDFLADAQKLTDASKNQYGFGTGYSAGLPFRIWMTLLWQHNGGAVLTPDGTKAAFNTPAGIESLQFMYDLTYKYKVAPQGEDDVDTDFKKGIIGMVIEGPWEMADFNTVSTLHYATAMVPTFYDQPAVWANSHTIAFPDNKKPENTLAAMTFTKWLFDHDFDWTKGTGHQPVRKSVINSAEFKALTDWQPIAASVPIAQFYPAIPQEWEVFARQDTSPFVVMMESVLLKKTSVADAIATAEKTINGILAGQ
jgi:multiple sugar transport system substrate-binding protein